MGRISSLVKSLDSSQDGYADRKQFIETLAQLAEAKADILALQLKESLLGADSNLNRNLPVESWIATVKHTHAISGNADGNITEQVTAAVKSFVQLPDSQEKSTNILDGIGKLIGTKVESFLAAPDSDEHLEFMVFHFNGLNAERLDLRGWKKEARLPGPMTSPLKIATFVGARSTIDLTKVHTNTFLALYARQLSAMNYNGNPLMEALEAAKNILWKLNGAR